MKVRFKNRSIQNLLNNKPVLLLSSAMLVFIVAALATLLHVSIWQGHSARYLSMTTEQGILSQRIANEALEAAAGKQDSFRALRQSRDRFQGLLGNLKNGVAAQGLPATPQEARAELKNLEGDWLELREKVDTILVSERSILSVDRFVSAVDELAPLLMQHSEEVVGILVKGKAGRSQIETASHQLLLSQRMQYNIGKALAGGGVAVAAIDQFGRDADQFSKVLFAMLEGDAPKIAAPVTNPQAIDLLKQIAVLYGSINDSAQQVINTTLNIIPALKAADEVSSVSDRVNQSTASLASVYATTPGLFSVGGFAVGPWMVIVLGVAALVMLMALGVQFLRDAHRREAQSEEVNTRNQEAIMRLLDEMGDLANGDLTVQATVTDDITGAIADSINYAIEALRDLVTTIQETSRHVAGSASETRQTTSYLSETSARQTDQISEAANNISEMTQTMDQMAAAASKSVQVASHSVDVASRGAETVHRTIQGMRETREQIQETSKRIKRLGESSQQIGEIVELIDDIADQTNILALNAAMQAAMAGEAGRGFAVVADEVQRLAERSRNATKQIDGLVKTIQADTNEAVHSMEQSTAGVVRGANLAETANQALREIEQVSEQISGMTRKIAESAQQQSAAAGQITSTMGAIGDTTHEAAGRTNQTTESVGVLADLAVKLQESVSGFKLPNA